MKISDICNTLNLKILAGSKAVDTEITGVYICDLLSWVMSHGAKGDAWITVMTHTNVIAVASLLELGCVILPENVEADEDALIKAEEEGIPVLSTTMSAHTLSVELYKLGIGK